MAKKRINRRLEVTALANHNVSSLQKATEAIFADPLKIWAKTLFYDNGGLYAISAPEYNVFLLLPLIVLNNALFAPEKFNIGPK